MGTYKEENYGENEAHKLCKTCRVKQSTQHKAISYSKRLVVIALVTLFSLTCNAYVLTHEGQTQTHLYKRLAGRQRRDIQREILSLLGMGHRPRPNSPRGFEKTSAPLYMLGLYSTTSQQDAVNARYNLATNKPLSRDRPQNDQPYFNPVATNRYPGSDARYGTYGTREGNHFPGDGALQHYASASGFHSNVVGSFENAIPEYDGVMSNDVERKLIDQSDLVISFINTKQQKGLDENYPQQSRETMKKQKSFYFDVRQIPSESEPSSSKLRLYKDVSHDSLSNSSLRISVHHTAVDSDGNFDLQSFGTRLVGAEQEGWLVYDVTEALKKWCLSRRAHFELRVSVESINGRGLKASKAGIVGRRGDPGKQAFLVAFFTDDEQTIKPPRRFQRSVDELDVEDDLEEDEEDFDDEDDDVTNEIFDDVMSSNGTQAEQNEEENGDESNDVTLTSSPRRYVTRAPQRKAEAGRGQTSKRRAKGNRRKKGRKKKNKKNSSRKKNAGPCHMEALYANFEDIGWQDWIMAPLGYSAYQCLGECDFPLNPPMNATNHAIVQSLVHLVKKESKLPKPCCVPSKLDEMSVLYYNDDSTVVYKKYKHMVARSCGCS